MDSPPTHSVPAYERRLDYKALRHVANVYGRAYQRRRVLAPCRVPLRGPAIVASNHTAGLDPIVLQSTCPRPIIWVMTAEFYDVPSLKWFLSYVHMIRVDRTSRDPAAWREAIRQLDDGMVVGVFPEGRIERTGELLPFETGVALLAARGNADIYPVYVDGRQRNTPMLQTYLSPQEPTVAWGEPVRLADSANDRGRLRRMTDTLFERVTDLKHRFPAPRRRGKSMLRSFP